MAMHHAEIVITAAPEQIFPFLIEPALLRQWLDGLIESTPLTEGGPRVGARSREVVKEGSRRLTFLTEITHLEVNRTIRVNLEGDIGTLTSTYELETGSDGTRVRHRLEARYKGLMRFMAPMLGGAVQRKLDSDLQRLKQAAERGD